MLLKLLALFIAVPLVELILLLLLAEKTSALTAFTVVVVTGVAGTLLARSQGWKTLRRIRLEFNSGQLPTGALLDAAMIFCAGALLLTPGLLTDILGLSLLIPWFRQRCRRRITAWIDRHLQVQSFGGASAPERTKIIDSYVVQQPSTEESARDRDAP